MFYHNEEYVNLFPTLVRQQINGMRWYCDPDVGVWMPSVTTVISYATKGKYDDWKAKNGKEKTDQIMKHACNRGTKLHKVIEEYIKNNDYSSLPEYKDLLVSMMFKSAKFYLDTRFDNVLLQEKSMYSKKLKVAGSCDYIGGVDYELSVVDFKGSTREKPEEWLENYFIQKAMYWAMFSSWSGLVPKKLVCFLITEQMEVQIVEERNIYKYLTKAEEYAKLFYDNHEVPTIPCSSNFSILTK